MAVSAAFALSAFAGGEYITLLKDDERDQGMSSFLKNPTEMGYGWSDGRDPGPDRDYLIDGKKLVTPQESAEDQYLFPGRSLTLQNSTTGDAMISYRSVNTETGVARPVCFNDLIVKSGYLSNDQLSQPNIWGGKITFDAESGNKQSCLQFRTHLNSTYIRAKLIAPTGNSVGYWGYAPYLLEAVAYSWKYHLEGDCSEFCATNYLNWCTAVFVDTPVVPGAFKLNNVTKLSFGTKGVSDLTGPVVGRDAYLEVPAGKKATLASVDFAWATVESHVSKGIDSYTGEAVADPYVYTHKLTKQAYYLNRISVADNANLGIAKATLDDTEIVLGRDACLAVGDLTMNGGILKAAGTLAVTNSLTVTKPISVRLSDQGLPKVALVTLPVGKGILSLDDFDFAAFEGWNRYRFAFEISVGDGLQTLWLTDKACGTYDATTGYVTLTNKDADGVSFTHAGNWSDGQPPHPGTNYYAGTSFATVNGNATFEGDVLAIGECFYTKNYFSNTATFKELHLLSGGSTSSPWNGINDMHWAGTMMVFSSAENPFEFQGRDPVSGYAWHGWDVNMTVCGDLNASIRLNRTSGTAINSRVAFPGDTTGYYGSICVSEHMCLRLGNYGLPNGTVVLAGPCALLTYSTTNGADIAIGAIQTLASTTNDVPNSVKSLTIGDLELTGKLVQAGAAELTLTGTATAGADAELELPSVPSLFLRSRNAVNGIALTLPAGITLVRDIADGDASFVADGAYTTAAVTAVGEIRVVIRGDVRSAGIERVVLMTVPTASATALAQAMTVGKIHGYKATVRTESAGNGQTRICVDLAQPGFLVIAR